MSSPASDPGSDKANGSHAPVEPGSPKDPGGPGAPVHRPDPEIVPSSTPSEPTTVPSPPSPEGEPSPDQAENASSSQGEPSDGAGGE